MPEINELVEKLGSLGLLERLSESDKKLGVASYKVITDLIKHKDYKREQGIIDDFIPDTGPYNAAGAIYPLLNREQKDEVLMAHLDQFKGLNYVYVSANHTPFIREPLLLADITIAKRDYWPGLKDQKDLWKDGIKNLLADGLFDSSKVKSDFLLAYALMRSDLGSIGEEYVKAANPDFLDGVLKGIVALRFAGVEDAQKIEERRNRLHELLPESVHDRIESLRQEADWTGIS